MFFAHAARQQGGGGGRGFRGGGPGEGFFYHPAGGNQRRQPPAEPDGARSFFGFLPVIFLFVWFVVIPFFSSGPAYALQEKSGFPARRVVHNCVYWVAQDFEERYPTPEDRAVVERSVLYDYLRHYEAQCGYDRRQRASQLMWASYARRQEVNAIPLPNCVEYDRLLQAVRSS